MTKKTTATATATATEKVNPEDYDEIMIVIGSKNELTVKNAARAALTVVVACTYNKKANITLSLDGYNDDPRELWEIPEADMYIRMFVTALLKTYPAVATTIRSRLTPESINWEVLH